MIKTDIRKIITNKRNILNKSWVNKQSIKIHRRLISTKEFKESNIIMFYITKDNEVDTKLSIELALRLKKTVLAPCVDKKNCRLNLGAIEDLKNDLTTGRYDILEPRKRNIGVKKIDLIITPGIAFDTNGNRLGRGKAYYDKFFKNIKHVHRIGLAFDFQILKNVPIHNHDIPMDKIITEKRTIKSKRCK